MTEERPQSLSVVAAGLSVHVERPQNPGDEKSLCVKGRNWLGWSTELRREIMCHVGLQLTPEGTPFPEIGSVQSSSLLSPPIHFQTMVV